MLVSDCIDRVIDDHLIGQACDCVIECYMREG